MPISIQLSSSSTSSLRYFGPGLTVCRYVDQQSPLITIGTRQIPKYTDWQDRIEIERKRRDRLNRQRRPFARLWTNRDQRARCHLMAPSVR